MLDLVADEVVFSSAILLEKDAIPHHKVGTHRRVYLKDLMGFQRQRDSRRRATLDDLRRKAKAAGLYQNSEPMNANFRVLLDACVLANFGLCDLFLALVETPRLY
ncbi:MAG TPA: hypothetical protein P5555_04315 [Candidatus Paceibacterota bacterium]|nr:hypothetical protein [Verrucomicrobiota bacterium]HOX02663.1 hypothetical protein [Verrucomicrobiota bacterium]HRZ44396.1 hypothetical protein [Candidatus Paceibacterota bacterium]HRZ55749.1 hypothetical protein [Candidatus Paceibacterota bacterium]